MDRIIGDVISFLKKYVGWSLPQMEWNDILEIIILGVLIYYILVWVKKNRAWFLVKGLFLLLGFTLLTDMLEMTTISWILDRFLSVGLVAIVVIFQPEFRKALERLGRRGLPVNWFIFDDSRGDDMRFSNHTIDAIVQATFEMGRAKTGALIVLEQEQPLNEYAGTGIPLDAEVSSQLLVQIFEHNTPLHDGAAIIRGNRIVAATCYLPLSDNMDISKELGTRHRAGVGISEVTDSLTIIASEETGSISLAVGGELIRNMDSDSLRNKLLMMQKQPIDVKRFRLWKGRQKTKNERKAERKADK